MTKKDLITLIFGCLAVLSIIWSNGKSTADLEGHISNKMRIENLEVLRQIDSSRYLINTFQTENRTLHKNLERMVQERKDLQTIQQQITKQYKSVYEKISGTNNDTLQLGITSELLAKHRNTHLERD